MYCGYGFSVRSGGKEPIYQDQVVHMTHIAGQDDSCERTVALPSTSLVGLRFHCMAKAGRHLWQGSSPASPQGHSYSGCSEQHPAWFLIPPLTETP